MVGLRSNTNSLTTFLLARSLRPRTFHTKQLEFVNMENSWATKSMSADRSGHAIAQPLEVEVQGRQVDVAKQQLL